MLLIVIFNPSVPSFGQDSLPAPIKTRILDQLEAGQSLSSVELQSLRSSLARPPQQANLVEAFSDSSYSRSFIVGVVTGSFLLVIGLSIGIWIGRKEHATRTSARETDRALNMFVDMFQFANGFAGDVSQCRHFVERVMKIAANADSKSGPQKPTDTERLLTQIAKENEHLQRRLDDAEVTLKTQADSLESYLTEARTDGLTRLPNRRAFDDELARRLAEWRRSNKPFSVLLIDVDHFKSFNDRYGHLAGDAVLTGVAQAIQQATRQSDLVARFGGEEFAVILAGAGMKEATLAAERTRSSIEKATFQYEGRELRVTASCGVAQAATGEAAADLLKRADVALYASKDAGRNAAHWHDRQRCWRIQGGQLLATHAPNKIATSNSPAVIPPKLQEVCNALSQRLDEVLSE